MRRLPSNSSFSSTTSSADQRPHPPHPRGNSPEDTLSSSTESSSTIVVNLSQKYARIHQTDSFRKMWSIIHPITSPHQLQLEQVLDLHPDFVQGAFCQANCNTPTSLLKDYIGHTENATHLCLNLQRNVYDARALYAGLHDFLHDLLPLDSDSRSSFLTQSQCDHVFDLFGQFNLRDNPFACLQPHNFDFLPQMGDCFSQLKQHLQPGPPKSRSHIPLLVHLGCCFGGSRSHFNETAPVVLHVPPLKSIMLLNGELCTLDCVVRRLCNAVGDDKDLISMALENGCKKRFIMGFVNDLCNSHPNLLLLLEELEECICRCFISVNKARALLLQEIHLHHTVNQGDYRQSAANSHENFEYSPG